MSSKWRQLILCRTIQCIETMSSCTSIASYYKNGDTMCWKERTLLLSELYSQKPTISLITFKISINILKIICKKNKQILYPNMSQFGDKPRGIEDLNISGSDFKQQQSIIWSIQNDTLTKFRSAYHSKSFESKKYNDKMWCLRCYPNGISQYDEGYLGLYLTLCGLPPNISKIKVLYTFRCKEFKNLKHSRIKNFSYEDKSSWGVSRFFEFIQLHKIRSLTIYVDITVMNEYDEEGKEILPQLNYINNNSSFDSASPGTSGENSLTNKRSNTVNTVNTTNTINTANEDTEEEKVNNVDFDSVHAVISSSMSSALDNNYKQFSSSLKNKQQQLELTNLVRKVIKKEIQQLQMSYNIKLNSLCSIVEQIQLNNDKLSEQTTQMMKTVGDVCGIMQKERSKLKNNKSGHKDYGNDIEMIRSELESIKGFILQQTQKTLLLSDTLSNKTRFSNDTNDEGASLALQPDTDPDIDPNTEHSQDHEHEPEQDDDSKQEIAIAPVDGNLTTMNKHSNHILSQEEEVKLWLIEKVGMAQYIDNFIDNGFDDMDVIKEITINELNHIGIQKLGHKMKLLQHIRKLWGDDGDNNHNTSRSNSRGRSDKTTIPSYLKQSNGSMSLSMSRSESPLRAKRSNTNDYGLYGDGFMPQLHLQGNNNVTIKSSKKRRANSIMSSKQRNKTHKKFNMSVMDMNDPKLSKIKVRKSNNNESNMGHNKRSRNFSVTNMKRIGKTPKNKKRSSLIKKKDLSRSKSSSRMNTDLEHETNFNIMKTKAYSDAAVLNEGPPSEVSSSKNINV